MGLEIEHKYVIKKVDLETLKKSYSVKVIKVNQIYLKATEGERRVRREEIDGKIVYVYTEKKGSGLVREETEKEITEKEFLEYLLDRDYDLNEISKVRYVIPYEGHNLEIDNYNVLEDYAILEVEVSSEKDIFKIIPQIKLVLEVTDDKRFKNKNLAKDIGVFLALNKKTGCVTTI